MDGRIYQSSSSMGFDLGAGASSTSVGPSPGIWLAAHRVDLTYGKTALFIFVAKFYGRPPFLSPTPTQKLTPLPAVLAIHFVALYPSDLGCWYDQLVVLFRWPTATAPRSQSVDSHCEASFWYSCHFLVLCEGLEKTPRWVTHPG